VVVLYAPPALIVFCACARMRCKPMRALRRITLTRQSTTRIQERIFCFSRSFPLMEIGMPFREVTSEKSRYIPWRRVRTRCPNHPHSATPLFPLPSFTPPYPCIVMAKTTTAEAEGKATLWDLFNHGRIKHKAPLWQKVLFLLYVPVGLLVLVTRLVMFILVCVSVLVLPRAVGDLINIPLLRLVCGLVVRHNYKGKPLANEPYLIAGNHVSDFGMSFFHSFVFCFSDVIFACILVFYRNLLLTLFFSRYF
jgi:hypothetical protein